jgi:hypothetical protein
MATPGGHWAKHSPLHALEMQEPSHREFGERHWQVIRHDGGLASHSKFGEQS